MPTENNTPINVSDEVERAREDAEKVSRAVSNRSTRKEALDAVREAAGMDEPLIIDGKRAFVAPFHKNGKFLIKPGAPVSQQLKAGQPPGSMHRDGDLFARFIGNTLITDDEQIIAWCESHPEICRDATLPSTEIWVTLMEQTRDTATKERSLPGGIDIDAIMRGDASALSESSVPMVAQARAQLMSMVVEQ